MLLSGQPYPPAALPLLKEPTISTEQETGCILGQHSRYRGPLNIIQILDLEAQLAETSKIRKL